MRRIVILGGYGNTGLRIARLLATRSDVSLVLAGRSASRAAQAAATLRATAANPVESLAFDATSERERRAAFDGASLVVAASSTSTHAAAIARDAIALGADAYDTNLSLPAKIASMWELSAEAERLERTIITDGGFHPGLPGAMARHAATLVPGLTAVRIGGAFNLDWGAYEFSPSTMIEFVEELDAITPESYDDGGWVRSWSAMRTIDFGGAIGVKQCIPWAMQEVRELPALIPTLRHAGFFIAGFSFMVDYLAMPAALLALRVAPSQKERIASAFLGALRHWTPPGEWAVLQLEAMGGDPAKRVKIRVEHHNGYDMTALPVVAGIEQLLDSPRRPGVFTQSTFVNPSRFLRRLEALGVGVQITVR